MEHFFIRLVDSFSGTPGYLLLGFCAFLENILPPVPGDTVTVFGGYLAATGRLSFPGVVAATTIGSFAGFMCMLFAGRALGRDFFFARNRALFPQRSLRKASAWFDRFGYRVVLANRFLPGARSVISVCAGISGLHIGRVAALCCISCLVWNTLLIGAGYALGDNWASALELLRRYNIVVGCVAGALLILVIARSIAARRRADKNG